MCCLARKRCSLRPSDTPVCDDVVCGGATLPSHECTGGIAEAAQDALLLTLEFAVAMSARRRQMFYGKDHKTNVKLQVAHIRTVNLSVDNVLASLPCGTPCSTEVRNGGR